MTKNTNNCKTTTKKCKTNYRAQNHKTKKYVRQRTVIVGTPPPPLYNGRGWGVEFSTFSEFSLKDKEIELIFTFCFAFHDVTNSNGVSIKELIGIMRMNHTCNQMK